MASEEDLRVAREVVQAVDTHFDASERLRLGKWIDPDERERTIAQHIVTAITAARAEGHRVAFQAGWDEGFQEAQLPDRFPHQNRCEVRYRERFPTNQGDKVFSREDEQKNLGR